MRRALFIAGWMLLLGCGALPPPPGWQGGAGGGSTSPGAPGSSQSQQPQVTGTQAVLPQDNGAWFSVTATVIVPQGARNPRVQLFRDGRLFYDVPQSAAQDNQVQFVGAFGSEDVAVPTDTSESKPGKVFVQVEVRLTADGAKPLISQSLLTLSCVADLPICGGKCTFTASDADHCGGCGNACPSDAAGARGFCAGGGCTWHSLKSTTPRSCREVCQAAQVGGQALGCYPRCGYDGDTGAADPEGGFSTGFVRRFNGAQDVIEPASDCWATPQSSNANGSYLEQSCCCGLAPVDD